MGLSIVHAPNRRGIVHCPHADQTWLAVCIFALYLADLNGNPWFAVLTAIQKDVLLLNLCQHPYPGLQVGVVTVMTSPKFSRICRDKFPCQVPNAKFWILGHNRLQTGAEALMDLVDIPTFGIAAKTSNQGWPLRSARYMVKMQTANHVCSARGQWTIPPEVCTYVRTQDEQQ